LFRAVRKWLKGAVFKIREIKEFQSGGKKEKRGTPEKCQITSFYNTKQLFRRASFIVFPTHIKNAILI
jgi:hypothetical protein